jgi:hypothetical protein
MIPVSQSKEQKQGLFGYKGREFPLALRPDRGKLRGVIAIWEI